MTFLAAVSEAVCTQTVKSFFDETRLSLHEHTRDNDRDQCIHAEINKQSTTDLSGSPMHAEAGKCNTGKV